MKTLNQIIKTLEAEYPTLRVGDEEQGYTELSTAEYDAQIAEWAQARLKKQAKIAEAEAQATAKSAILDRIGLTADELQTILG